MVISEAQIWLSYIKKFMNTYADVCRTLVKAKQSFQRNAILKSERLTQTFKLKKMANFLVRVFRLAVEVTKCNLTKQQKK